MNKKYEIGLLIGRFQPFHKGHLYLIRYALKKVDSLVIGIGSANIYDENNLLHYEERKTIIEKVIKEEKISRVVQSIIPVNDYYDDNLWYKHIVKRIGKIDVVVGNNEWTNGIFERKYYTILRVGFYKRYLYEGEKIRQLIKEKKNWQERLPDYLRSLTEKYMHAIVSMQYRFDHVGIGGTFDHFHIGHQKLVDRAFQIGRKVSIGISTEELYHHKVLSQIIESYDVRKKALSSYLKEKNLLKRADFFPLSDIYGRAKTDGTLEALVVSRETYANAIKVNRLREEKKLPQLKIMVVQPVVGDDGNTISSERIRKGEINREGNVYDLGFKNKDLRMKQKLVLPKYLREELRKPLGKVVAGRDDELEKTAKRVTQFINELKPTMVIAVGDIIAMSLEKKGFWSDVKIIDYRSRRQDIKTGKSFKGLTFPNQPGTVTFQSVEAIKKAIEIFLVKKKPQTVVIKGEEDLLALPAILFTPLGSIVLYGQINLGVIMIVVTEEKKKQIVRVMNQLLRE